MTNTGNNANQTQSGLDAIAADINKAGESGDALMLEMAKGTNNAIDKLAEIGRGLLRLAKGKGSDDDDDEGDDEGDDDDDDSEGGDEAGYERMEMGSSRQIDNSRTNPAETRTIDATEFILDASARIKRLEKSQARGNSEIRKLRRDNRQLRRQNESLGAMLQQSTEATVGLLAPLVKAMADARLDALDTPERPITPHHTTPQQKPAVDASARIGGSERTELQCLAKAVRLGSLDIATKTKFIRERRFSDDDGIDRAMRAAVEKFVPDFQTTN